MANRKCCSYDTRIECDSMYEFREFYRQMARAYESGILMFFVTGPDMCPCLKKDCPRYLAAQQKRNNGR